VTKIPVITFRELDKTLKRLGFEEKRRRGSHVFYRHADGRTTTAPDHKGRDIAPPLLVEILREINVSVGDFIALLGK